MYSRHNEFFYRYETLFACVVELFQLVCNVVGYSLALLTVSSHTRAGDERADVDRVLDRDQVGSHGESVAVNAGVRDQTAFIKIILHEFSLPID